MILIIHHDDLDGWTAAKIVEVQESQKEEEVHLLPFDYGDPTPETSQYSLVYILDLPLSALPGLSIDNVLHIDHHYGPISPKTIICKTSVALFCWEWFHSKQNMHIEAIDEYDTQGPFGAFLAYGLGASILDWKDQLFWDTVLEDGCILYSSILSTGKILRAYLKNTEIKQLAKAPIIYLNKEPIPLLQGPIHTLKSSYIAIQMNGNHMDFKIQHPSAPSIASFYGGSGHGTVGGFHLPLADGITLLQKWLFGK